MGATVTTKPPVSQTHASMTGFDIKPLDLGDDNLMQRMLEIHQLAFPDSAGLERQLRHNTRDAPKGTMFIGAFDGDRLVGFNGFIRHSIIVGGRRLTAYQSCSTATDPGYRGRGIFSAIIRHALRVLAAEGLFICGFPNDNSGPIFTKQLGFNAIPLVRLLIPGILMGPLCAQVGKRLASLLATHDRQTISFDQTELVQWKSSLSGKSISKYSFSGVQVWGYEYRKSVLGLNLTIFAVGGISAGENEGSVTTMKNPNYFQRSLFYSVVAPTDSAIAQVTRFHSLRNDAGIFIYNPMRPLENNPHFDVFAGLADFY